LYDVSILYVSNFVNPVTYCILIMANAVPDEEDQHVLGEDEVRSIVRVFEDDKGRRRVCADVFNCQFVKSEFPGRFMWQVTDIQFNKDSSRLELPAPWQERTLELQDWITMEWKKITAHRNTMLDLGGLISRGVIEPAGAPESKPRAGEKPSYEGFLRG